ncbi:MAG: hypothetical protein ACHQT8_07825 [Chlamydiales bacterium]
MTSFSQLISRARISLADLCYSRSYPERALIVEWTSNSSVYSNTISSVIPLPSPLVSLVTDYLQKIDLVGPQQLEAVCGVEWVTKMCQKDKALLSPAIDCTLQESFPFHTLAKTTEMTSCVYVPAKLTASKMRALLKTRGIEVVSTPVSEKIFQIFGDAKGKADHWYLVAHSAHNPMTMMHDDDIFDRIYSKNYEWVRLRVLLFAIFFQLAWNRPNHPTPPVSYEPRFYLSCRELFDCGRVSVGVLSQKGKMQIKVTVDLNHPHETVAGVMKRVDQGFTR